METFKIGAFATLSQNITPSGNIRVEIMLTPYPGRVGVIKKRFYRKSVITNIDTWVKSFHGRRIVQKFSTYYLGQMLVSHYRQAIESKEISKEQAKQIKERLNDKYGENGTYINRYWQSDAAKELERLTQNKEFYLTDVWL